MNVEHSNKCLTVRLLHCRHWLAGHIRMAGHFTAGFASTLSVESALNERSRTCSGKFVWFDAVLAQDLCYSCDEVLAV